MCLKLIPYLSVAGTNATGATFAWLNISKQSQVAKAQEINSRLTTERHDIWARTDWAPQSHCAGGAGVMFHVTNRFFQAPQSAPVVEDLACLFVGQRSAKAKLIANPTRTPNKRIFIDTRSPKISKL
jgi:hypothetical protein